MVYTDESRDAIRAEFNLINITDEKVSFDQINEYAMKKAKDLNLIKVPKPKPPRPPTPPRIPTPEISLIADEPFYDDISMYIPDEIDLSWHAEEEMEPPSRWKVLTDNAPVRDLVTLRE
jgi:hypothetical protein